MMNRKIVHGRDFRHPVDEGTFGDFFFSNAEKFSDKICQIDGGTQQTETFGSVKLRSTRVAIAMQKRGITSDDVITFCSGNTMDNTIPLLAAFYLGAKVTNLESSLSVRHTKHLLSLVTPKMIFVEEAGLNLIEESLIGTDFPTEIVVFGDSSKYSKFVDFLNVQEKEEEFRPPKVDPNDTALMFFSSGTTGLPKAIAHSHRSFLHVTLQVFQLGMRDNIFQFTNFYWMTAFIIITSCFKSGSPRIFSRDLSAETILKIVEKYKVSSIFTAPILTYRLTNFENLDKYDTSSLRLIMCVGTPMSESQLEKMNNLFPTAVTVLGYGMSELGAVSGFDTELDRDIIKRKLTSCGRLAPGVHMKVVDLDDGKELGPNQTGEILLKAASMMKGYYKIETDVFDDEGFLKTGDLGYYDDDECVYVVDRIKEMFKYQSWHIIPSSIETVLSEHPAVKEVVVFGLPKGEEGEVPAAAVVMESGYVLDEHEIDEFLKGRVADRERLRGGVSFLEVLPRTPTGKIARREVKDFVVKLNI